MQYREKTNLSSTSLKVLINLSCFLETYKTYASLFQMFSIVFVFKQSNNYDHASAIILCASEVQ